MGTCQLEGIQALLTSWQGARSTQVRDTRQPARSPTERFSLNIYGKSVLDKQTSTCYGRGEITAFELRSWGRVQTSKYSR